MLLKDFEIAQINYWSAYTLSIDGSVYDIAIINYTHLNLELKFKFKRFKGLCYYEGFRDYGETYTSDIEFSELRGQLLNIVPYLELTKNIEEVL